MTILEALRTTTQGIKTWAENKFLNKDNTTADDFGVYVQDTEPTDAVDGDIWVDTANDPTVMSLDVPTKTSDLINDSGYITSAPVTSVNGQTGAVTISALPAVTTADNGKVLMVVNGAWQVVDLNMSIDANGVVSV